MSITTEAKAARLLSTGAVSALSPAGPEEPTP